MMISSLLFYVSVFQKLSLGPAFTCSSQVNSIQALEDGEFAAATMGGVLVFGGKSDPLKLTIIDGLPSNEVLAFRTGPDLFAKTNAGDFELPFSCVPNSPFKVTESSVQLGSMNFPWSLPPSMTRGGASMSGEHFVATLGKGLARWTGKEWAFGVDRQILGDQVTAIGMSGSKLAVGTADRGLFLREKGRWARVEAPNEISNHNIQNLFAIHHGRRIAIAPMEGNCLIYSFDTSSFQALANTNRTRHFARGIPPESRPVLTTAEQEAFRLVLRNNDGKLKEFWDYQTKEKGQLRPSNLSLKIAPSLLEWSSFIGGQTPTLIGGKGILQTAHFRDVRSDRFSAYPNAVVTSAIEFWSGMAVGTQREGLAIKIYGEKEEGFHWLHQVRPEAPAWITVLCSTYSSGYTLIAGTFDGSLIAIPTQNDFNYPNTPVKKDSAKKRLKDARIIKVGAGAPITSIINASNGLFIGTRKGLYKCRFYFSGDGNKRTEEIKVERMPAPFDKMEVQALEECNEGIFIGTRTGLYFWTGFH